MNTILDTLNPSEDYFGAAQGLYWHCADYHEGQSSERYSIMSAQLGYRPALSESGPEPGSVAEYIYDALASGDVEPSDVLAFVEQGYDETR